MTHRPATAALAVLLALAVPAGARASDPGAPILAQHPSISRTQVVFACAGDLWLVGLDGGKAVRLTAGAGIESDPYFSPDGALVAFTGQYDGNTDVFVVPAAGGVPRRLTYHPDPDEACGWTPDGRRVLFRAARTVPSGIQSLFTVALEGGPAEPLPLPTGVAASYAPDGARLACVPTMQWQRAWKRYRGGQTTPVWIVALDTLEVEEVPRDNSNDSNPMWVGGKVYFLSDRGGPVSLFAYDVAAKTVAEALANDGLDFKSASAGPGGIVVEQFGALRLFDPATGRSRPLPVEIDADLAEVRPRYVKVGDRISAAAISPNGARAAFEARGEILTVPADKGDVRNLTRTTGVMERDPSWSPDGRSVAYFSDESGEYALHVRDQGGLGAVRKIALGQPPSFFYRPLWSPDGRKIAYNDKRLTLWYVDLAKGVPVKVDTTHYYNPRVDWEFEWSPDSRWLTYSKQLPSHIFAVFVYSLEDGRARQVTDGLGDARFPVFDKGGSYLFFAASTDVGLTPGWLNMSSMERPVTRSVYVAVLRKDLPSPLAPESDEEKAEEGGKEKKAGEEPKAGGKKDAKAGAAAAPPKVAIDFEGLGQRILALPVPAKNYVGLQAGKEGTLFVLEGPPIYAAFTGGEGGATLHKFDLAKRKLDKFADGVRAFRVAAAGEKMLLAQGKQWLIVAAEAAPEPGKGVLGTEAMEVYAEPLVEWRQMYREVWRIERDFFYDPGLHGLDLAAAEKRYAPYLEAVASRQDLNYLFEEMLGELTCGHVFVGGGDRPEVKRVGVGLLGADYEVVGGRYRFARIYDGENWNPRLKAPLTQPGVDVRAGEFLLAVGGREVTAAEDVHKAFEATAGRQTVIRVGPSADGKGAREVTVVPVDDESGLRTLAWVEDNRRKVDRMSGGRLAYVWLPDTAEGGYANFNRYYFAQVGKQGAVIDERYNQGGLIADYVIDYMRRPLMGYFAAREGADYITPVGSIYGPKVMIVNEYAGSGGDMMPWLFRAAGIGPLVGKRTWGGLVGMAGAAPLMDGGMTGAPQSGFWNPDGTWDVENHGVDPDIEVGMDPAAVRAGRDPQLEKAVEVALKLLEKDPPPKHVKPAYPNYHKR